MQNFSLKKRIIEISYRNKLGHLGSCLGAVDIIDEIFSKKSPDEPFILSNGHAGLALYVVIEKYFQIDAEKILARHGIHPVCDPEFHLDCSTGSLGMGLTVAVGFALSNREREVYCMISDGECAEGSIWEALRFTEDNRLDNLNIHLFCNGIGAYGEIDRSRLSKRIWAFSDLVTIHYKGRELPFLSDKQEEHYRVLSESDFDLLMVDK